MKKMMYYLVNSVNYKIPSIEEVPEAMSPSRTERTREASRRRREQQKQEVRRSIVEAAAALFQEHGYEQFSLRQVAERIGYTATTIYLYFADKDELLFTLADEGFARFTARLGDAAAGASEPLARLGALWRAYLAFAIEQPVYYRLMFMQRGDYLVAARAGEMTPRIASLEILRGAMQQAIDAGALRPGDAPRYADALWALIHGVASLYLAMPSYGRERAERTAETAAHALLEGLRAPETAERSSL
jgi:AcrR family transcriptional regulator